MTSPAVARSRIEVISDLLRDCVYTDPVRARQLLSEFHDHLHTQQEALPQLEYRNGQDYTYNYTRYLACLESQEYRHEAAAPHFLRALAIAEDRGDLAERLELYLDYTGHLCNVGQTEEASEYLDRCYRLLEALPSDQFRARAACRHGYLYLLFFGYPKATRKFLEADNLLESGAFTLSPKDHYFYALTQAGLGAVYQNSDEREEAITAFQKAIGRCESIGLRARLPWHQLNLGKELLAGEEYLEALSYFQAVVKSNANGSLQALAATYANMGYCYHYLDAPREATRYLDRAEALYRSQPVPDQLELAIVASMRATLLMDGGQWEAAIAQIQQLLRMVQVDTSTSDPQVLSLTADAYLYLSMAYEHAGDYRTAYQHHCTYDEYNRQYLAQIDIIRQQQFAAQFRAEEREQENRQLKLRASQLQLRALRAQMNPHFLYNALNNIQSFISDNDAATASRYLAKFAMLMRQSLEYSNREAITLEEERQFLSDYLEINRHLHFDGQLTYSITVGPQLEEDIIGVPTMILQPYVENAIEHGLRGQPRGHIEVTFAAEGEDYLIASVTDNGIGRKRVRERQARDPSRVNHQSRGTEITESRLALLSGTATRGPSVTTEDLYGEDGTGCGTRVWVTIPILEVPPLTVR